MKDSLAIGVDIGGTNIRVATLSGKGKIISKTKTLTSPSPLDILYKLIDASVKIHKKDICGIGIAVAGIIQDELILSSPNIPAIENINLKTELSNRYKYPIFVENDANVAALGEQFIGVGKKYKNFILLTLGTGIGSGIIKDGKLLQVAAEIGHTSINSKGLKCLCGNIGCLEMYASSSAIINNIITQIEKGQDSIVKNLYNNNFYKVTSKDIYNAALDGDILSITILKDAGKSLGVGITNIINLLSPDAIILTGGLINVWNIYVESAIKESSLRALPSLYKNVKIIPSLLGDNAGIIGATRLVFENINKCKK